MLTSLVKPGASFVRYKYISVTLKQLQLEDEYQATVSLATFLSQKLHLEHPIIVYNLTSLLLFIAFLLSILLAAHPYTYEYNISSSINCDAGIGWRIYI